MSEKVKLSKDGSSIDFVQSESIPTSLKKFRQSPEIEGFYRFIYENDLQKEAYEILERIIQTRKAKKAAEKAAVKEANKAAKDADKVKAPPANAKVITREAAKSDASKSKEVKPAMKASAPKGQGKTIVKAAATKPAAKIAKTATPAKSAKPAVKAKAKK